MKKREQNDVSPASAGGASKSVSSSKTKRRRWTFGMIFVALAIIAIGARLVLPSIIKQYVNRALDRNLHYAGKIGAVRAHLWRGAYSVENIRLSKRTGNVPTPFFTSQRVDFAIQWNALLQRRLVGRILIDHPEINFVDAPASDDSQSGAGGPWLQTTRDLFPFRINSALVRQGSVHFRAYQAKQPVDVYLNRLDGSIDNLSNIRGETTPLVAKVQATALVMDQAPLEFLTTIDPYSYRPTFHLATRLLGLDVTKLNDLAQSYGHFNFKHGWFDLVIEADAKEGQLNGYVIALFRQLEVFSLERDLKDDDALQFFWQAVLGLTSSVFKNHPRDQFGTLIPFSGDLSGRTSADILATIGNILRNAFVRAYLPRLQGGERTDLHFETPQFIDALPTTDHLE